MKMIFYKKHQLTITSLLPTEYKYTNTSLRAHITEIEVQHWIRLKMGEKQQEIFSQ